LRQVRRLKRLDALLHAAAIHEQHQRRILTLVIGSGPHKAQVELSVIFDAECEIR
jgi:hypothetical protein